MADANDPAVGRPALLRRAVLRLSEMWDETHDTRTFRFEAPPGGLPNFRPGQFYAIEIPTKDGAWIRRSYSVASSPLETGGLDFTVKILEGGAGTTALFHHMKVGDSVRASGPFGEFTLEVGRPSIFVAGGVGVTPIMSMLRTLDATRSQLSACLLYSNRARRDVIFEKELRAIERRNPNFHFHYALTREAGEAEAWFSRARFGAAEVARICEGMEGRVGYLCGPDAMMEEAGRALLALGIPRADIRMEAFLGTGPTL
jgi:propane monooxygenase reductase subunit